MSDTLNEHMSFTEFILQASKEDMDDLSAVILYCGGHPEKLTADGKAAVQSALRKVKE